MVQLPIDHYVEEKRSPPTAGWISHLQPCPGPSVSFEYAYSSVSVWTYLTLRVLVGRTKADSK